MCKKFIIVLALSLFLISSASAGMVSWDFENGNEHRFDLWSVVSAVGWIDDPNIAGDESLTGVGGHTHLPGNGVTWTIGPPNQFDGQIPAVEEGCHVVNGLLEYGPCNDPFGVFDVEPPSYTNSRGQTSYLNTYNLTQWGDGLHTADNDQIATSPPVVLGENAVLTVWSHGGGSGTHAPEYDPDPAMMYTDGSSGIAVLSAEEEDKWALLASLYLHGHGTLTEDTLDLSAFAGKTVFIDVVDAFEGSWGWLAVDEIQITNASQLPLVGFVVQTTEGVLDWGFDAAQVDHLKELGYDVQVIDMVELSDGAFTRADANALDLLIISESIGSSSADPLRGTSTPVMHEEAYGWDNWAFMGPADNIHWLAEQTEVEVVNDTHPIMVDTGFPLGMLPWFTAPDQYTTENISNMAPGAELLCKATVEDSAVVFAVEKGAELANGELAPNRRVGFSIPGNQDGLNQVNGIIDASIMTDEQWALYDAAIRWLNPPPTAAMIVSDVNLANGFDQAQYDRLGSMGYDVMVVPSSDVGSTFTIAKAETFDVLLVSESISSSSADPLIGANVPMMHNESYGWDNHGFIDNANKGPAWVSDATVMDVVNDAHPITMDAGLSAGLLEFYINPGTSWTADLVGALAPGAVNLAQINSGGTDYVLVFAIEQGAELANSTQAANRIVGFSIPGNNSYPATEITDEGWAFWEAAIRWLDAVD
jgi:hypothetical protein